MESRNRASLLKRVLIGTLLLALLSPIVPAPRPAVAAGYITDNGSHPPPTSGPYAYFATYGTFSPSQSGFPAVGGTFVDPVFGTTIRRLSNELNQYSYSENYAKNGFINADATLMHHRAPSGHNIINTTTGLVVRANVPFNMDSSFAPDNPDIFYWFTFGSPTLNKYSVSTGTSSAVKTFAAGLTQLGGSVDWIDASGRYMVLMLGGVIRVYDVKSDILYAGSIPASYASSGGWVGISPDGNYVITATDPPKFHSFKIDHATKSVSTAAVLFWTLCGDHADVVSSSNGKTYLVAFECHSEAAIYAVDVSLPQSAADVSKQRSDNKRIIKLASWTDTAGHFSGVSKGALKDWFFFTIESGDDTFTAPVTSAWRPYMQELIMANVITGEVRRLAHHRSRSVTTNYFYTPRPSASWDGSLVTWVSNFGHSSAGYADLYAINISATSELPPPPPPPTPTPLTLGFTNPAAGATLSGTATVSVSASGGSGSGYTYQVKAGTTTIYSGTNSTFSWNTTTAANGGVTLTATVTDAALATASASRAVTVSNTSGGGTGPNAPTVTITSPNSGVWTGAGLNIKATATDDTALTKIELWANGGIFATLPCAGTTCSVTQWWNSGILPTAAYEINAVAQDASGNRTVSSPITIYKDGKTPVIQSGATGGSTPPPPPPPPLTVAFSSPTAGSTVSGTKSFAIATTGATGTITLAPSVDGAPLPTQILNGSTGSFSVNTTTLTNASHTVAAKVTDGAGKTATASIAVTVSNTVSTPPPPPPPPLTVAFSSPTAGSTVSGTKTFTITTTGATGTITLAPTVDGAALPAQILNGSTGSFNVNTTTLTNATHTVAAKVTDGAGKTATVSIAVTVSNTVTPPPQTPPPTGTDTVAPKASITSPFMAYWTGTAIAIKASATDDKALAKIELWAGSKVFATLPCTGTACTGSASWNPGTPATGAHQISAVAVDSAGNRAVSNSISVFNGAFSPSYPSGAK